MTKYRELPMLTLILPILINLKDLFSMSWQFNIETYLYFSAVPKCFPWWIWLHAPLMLSLLCHEKHLLFLFWSINLFSLKRNMHVYKIRQYNNCFWGCLHICRYATLEMYMHIRYCVCLHVHVCVFWLSPEYINIYIYIRHKVILLTYSS